MYALFVVLPFSYMRVYTYNHMHCMYIILGVARAPGRA